MKYNFIYILFLFTIAFSNAQEEVDSLAIRSIENKAFHSTSKPVEKKFETNFQSKYKGDAYNYQTKLDHEQVTAWEKFKKKIADFFSRLFSFSTNGKVFSNIEIIMKIIGFAIIGFVIFMIVKLILNKEGGWVFSRNTKKINVNTIDEENIHFINFKDVIASSKLKNEYRIATRYYYLWLLKSLSDRTVIDWDIEKTNTDYLSEIKNTEFKKEFEFLSYIYDYCWYGEFELTQEDFEKAETHFINAIQNR
jgi:hypothetical protein